MHIRSQARIPSLVGLVSRPPGVRNDRHSDTWSSTDFYGITIAVQLAIYNSVILAWREKV